MIRPNDVCRSEASVTARRTSPKATHDAPRHRHRFPTERAAGTAPARSPLPAPGPTPWLGERSEVVRVAASWCASLSGGRSWDAACASGTLPVAVPTYPTASLFPAMTTPPRRAARKLGLAPEPRGVHESPDAGVPSPGAAPAAGPGEEGPARRAHLSLTLVGDRARRDTSDADLARGLGDGEAWAIAETWHRFAPMVLTTAERCLGSRSEAEDVAQEVFYRVFRKARTLRDPNSLRSFVYSFALRTLRTELRRRKLRSWLSLSPPEEQPDVGCRAPDVESRDLLRRFHALLDRLGPRDRLVFVLRRLESMTVEEIAARMDLSASTVKRSMAHASSRLSRWIDADPGLAGLRDEERWGR